jgi:hypothetical protein
LALGTYSHGVPELSTDAADRMGTTLWATTIRLPTTAGKIRRAEPLVYLWLPAWLPKRISRPVQMDETAGSYGCAARDSNPEPAD